MFVRAQNDFDVHIEMHLVLSSETIKQIKTQRNECENYLRADK